MYKTVRILKRKFLNKNTKSKISSEGNDFYLENCSGFIKINKENLLKNSNKWTTENSTKQGNNFIIVVKANLFLKILNIKYNYFC